MKTKNHLFLSVGMAAAFALLFSSCKKEYIEVADDDAPTVPRAVYDVLTVNWDWANGYYTTARAISNFGNIEGYSAAEENRCYITNNTLRIKLLKNLKDAGSGVVAKIDIKDHSAYELTFDVKTHSEFDFALNGGKAGFGFLIGDGFTGGDSPKGGTGGSFRLCWGVPASRPNEAYWKPYVYYVDQPGAYGDGFGARYPASGSSIQRATWYTVKLFAQANTYANYNGKIKLTINGTVVYSNNNFRWTTVHAKRKINYLSLSCFRGGGTGSESPTDGWLYFNNLRLNWVSAVY